MKATVVVYMSSGRTLFSVCESDRAAASVIDGIETSIIEDKPFYFDRTLINPRQVESAFATRYEPKIVGDSNRIDTREILDIMWSESVKAIRCEGGYC